MSAEESKEELSSSPPSTTTSSCNHHHVRENSALMCPSILEGFTSPKQIPGKVELSLDPAQLTHFQNQVSGHAILYPLPGGKVIKRSNRHEISIYEQIQRHRSLIPYTAGYFGYTELDLDVPTTTRQLETAESYRRENVYVILEDLTYGYHHPNIMDVKIGTRTVELTAVPEKFAYQTQKDHETTTFSHGARIDGLKVFHPCDGSTVRISHRDCWSRKLEDMFLVFLGTGEDKKIRGDIIPLFLEQLASLHSALVLHFNTMSFLQSSILLIYEADTTLPPRASVRLIDFDHSHIFAFDDPFSQPHQDHADCGCSFGVANLVHVLETIFSDMKSS